MRIGWLKCISQSLRPHFLLSFHDSECSRKPPNAHSLGHYVQQQKKNNMKTYQKIMIVFLFLNLFLLACNKNDDNQEIPNITYSESPFDLQGVSAKFAKNIAYDNEERTQFDIWLPSSSTPTSLVIYVHGGGFSSGDKDFVYAVQSGGVWDFPSDIRFLLQNNIAFATIRYTLLKPTGETEGIKKPMSDVKRALQFIRYRASELNIDKNKIIGISG